MGKYIHVWNNHSQHEEYLNGDDYIEPYVGYDMEHVHYNKRPVPHDYANDYLTFVALEDSTFKLSRNAVQYSLDDGTTWTSLATNTNTPTVTAGSKILWKAEGLKPIEYDGIGTFSSTGRFNVEGNVMSLLYGDNFIGQTDLTSKNNAFYRLFKDCTKLVSAKNLSLPATTLEQNCYQYMFHNCTSLTEAPSLLATTLEQNCYYSMFQGCTSLTKAPELPATTLEQNCYTGMFLGCTSLTTAPQLPATTLAEYCYSSMFVNCTSLTEAPELSATTLASSCYSSMFRECTSLTTAPELPATTLAQSCYTGMFLGCTSLTTAPQLPATTLAQSCYYYMFYGCKNLNYIKCLATDISASNCTYYWVGGVASSGTFVKAASMNNWTRGNNGIPSGWTIEDA